MKKILIRLTAMVLVVAMAFTLMANKLPVCAEEISKSIYVAKSGSDSNSGTLAAPVATIEKALELASNGDVIKIADSALSEQLSGDEPLCITKNVTISGGELTLMRAGIVLGADVTLDSISLNFCNPVRNAIIANGYTLDLNNVKGTGAYPVHVFGGEVTGYNGDGTLPMSGTESNIVVSGSNNNLGDIFAGSISEYGVANSWNENVFITMQAEACGTIGNVYACGATEPRGQGDGESMTPNSSSYIVTDNVTITLSGSKPAAIYGKTGGDTDAAVIVKGGVNQISNISFNDLESLTVYSGVLEPAALNENLNLSINSGAELNMSAAIHDGETFTVGDFTGGGILVMGTSDKMSIAGSITGTTEFQTSNNRPGDKSTSGVVEYEYDYIDVTDATGNGSFSFMPYMSQIGTTFAKIESGSTVVWKTSKQPENVIVKPGSFEIPTKNYAMMQEDINQLGLTVPLRCGLEDTEYFFDVPLAITISKNGAEPVTATGEYDESYGYTYYAPTLGFDEIYSSEDWSMDEYTPVLCFTTATSIDDGVYTINVSVELNTGEVVTQTITLIIGKVKNVPNAPDDALVVSYEVKNLADVMLPDKWMWSDADKDTVLPINQVVAVTAVYTGDDKDYYENVVLSIEVRRQAQVGDTNNDDGIDIKDAVMLKKHLASITTGIDMEAADLNGDSVVDIADAVKLMKCLAGVEE